MDETTTSSGRLRKLGTALTLVVALLVVGRLGLRFADGPVFVFAGGPLRSGDWAELEAVDWAELDAQSELEMELVGEESSLTLWFSVSDGAPYVACDLDCVGGMLKRWPQLVDGDDRVVLRIDDRRVAGRLIFVPHGSDEYVRARADRERKYFGDQSGRAAAEAAAHTTVVELGESLTGRDQRAEPGDRLYRVAARERDD